MAYCRKCGNWLPDTATRCNVCGEAHGQQPQQPQYQQPQYQQPQYRQPQYQQPQYQQPQYQQPQYQQPQYQQPQQPQNYPNTWSLPKSGGQAPNGYPKSVELGTQFQKPQQPPLSEDGPVKPKKKKGGKIALFIILGVVLAAAIGLGIFFLAGSAKDDDPNIGYYEAVSCYENGEEVEIDGEWIKLKERGQAVIHLDYKNFDAKWELKGEDLTIIQDGDEFYGTLEDGVLTLDLDGLEYTFLKEGASLPEAPTAAVEVAPTDAPAAEPPAAEPPAAEPPVTEAPAQSNSALEWWDGEWYGWWIVDEGWGQWEQYEQTAWDVCARISVDAANKTGIVNMWDEGQGAQSRWDVDVYFVDGSDDRGIMRSANGTFMNASMANGDWNVDPNAAPYTQFENFICISGTYQDPRNASNRLEYRVFLRPWGTDWQDIRNGDMSQMPYTDMMPIKYDSWYVPLLNSGAPMPNSFH